MDSKPWSDDTLNKISHWDQQLHCQLNFGLVMSSSLVISTSANVSKCSIYPFQWLSVWASSTWGLSVWDWISIFPFVVLFAPLGTLLVFLEKCHHLFIYKNKWNVHSVREGAFFIAIDAHWTDRGPFRLGGNEPSTTSKKYLDKW